MTMMMNAIATSLLHYNIFSWWILSVFANKNSNRGLLTAIAKM